MTRAQSNAQRKLSRTASLAVAAALALAAPALAQSTWNGTATDLWSDASKWTGGVPNAIDAIVNVAAPTTGKIQIDSIFTVGTLNLARATNLETPAPAFDPTKGLTLQVSTGVPTINTTVGDTFFFSSLYGTQGFNKIGSTKFTFRFNPLDQTYSGPINIGGGVLGIEKNSSLGNDDNDISIANGARLAAEPGSNSGTVTLPASRSITLAGAQSQFGANNVNVNFVIEGSISGVGGLTKVDAGKLSLNGPLSYAADTRVVGGILDFNTPGGAVDLTGGVFLEGNVGTQIDFSDLSDLSIAAPTRDFTVRPVTTASGAVFTVNALLAKNGPSSIIVNNFLIGGAGGSSQGNSNIGELLLGASTEINANLIRIGGFNGRGLVSHQAGVTPGTFKVRGIDGIAALPLLMVGETSSGVRSGLGVLDLTNATVDILVDEVRIGRHIANSANTPGNSRILMSAGTFKATTLVLSDKTGTGDVNANSAPTLASEFLQTGGTVEATSLLLGRDALGGPTPPNPFLFPVMNPTYNLNGGTLKAASIIGGPGNFNSSSTLTLNIAGGTLQNLNPTTDLTVNGRNTGAGGRINVVIGDNGGTISADEGRTVTLTANTVVSGAGTLTKAGLGTLTVNTTIGDAVIVSAGTFGGNATIGRSLTAAANTTISPGASIGTLSADAATLAGALSIEYQDAAGTTSDGLIDKLVITNALDISLASLSFTDFVPTSVLNDDSYIFASYGSLNGTFTSVAGVPSGYEVRYAFNGNNIALVSTGPSFVLGDFNFDGGVDASDIDPFVVAANEGDPFAGYIASSQAAFALLYPGQTLTSAIVNQIGDFNGDGGVDASDIDPFVVFANSGGGVSAIPEPAALGLLAPLGLLLSRRRRA